MREIKFRVFVDGKMYEPFDIRDSLTGHIEEKAVVMQHTGLKDKNGKEIYEGDILATNLGALEEIMVGKKSAWQITFCWGAFKAFRTDSKSGNEDSFWLHDEALMSHQLGHRLEIIGNIYENPELISSDKK